MNAFSTEAGICATGLYGDFVVVVCFLVVVVCFLVVAVCFLVESSCACFLVEERAVLCESSVDSVVVAEVVLWVVVVDSSVTKVEGTELTVMFSSTDEEPEAAF
ncbi:MAG: hypothetical protein IJZ88_00245 [Clostridia bacterium]|nr:hypothetical protein [Clostridia bacterium]